MRTHHFPVKILFVAFAIAAITSCKKDNTANNSNPITVFVVIGGGKYSTVIIGSQTWTIENYKGAGGVFYDEANSRPEYGKYYSYNEVKALVIPAGWRVPTMADFIKLGESQGVIFTDHQASKQEAGKKMISTTRWTNVKGNNQSGFNAYPANYIYGNNKPIDGDISEFWTSEGNTFGMQEGADKHSLRILFYDNSSADAYKFTVRFVKDN